MKKSTILNILSLKNYVFVARSGSNFNNVPFECEWQEVDNR
jgi:hypothetical protein